MMWSFLAIPVLLAAAFIIPLVSLKSEKIIPWVAGLGSLGALVLSLITMPPLWANKVLSFQMEAWQAPFGITIAIDGFSMLLIAIITSVGFFATLFSFRFIKERRTKYYSLLCLLLAGSLGAVHAGDIFNLFVFFEIMAISSYALTSYYRDAKAIEGSIKYLIMGSFSTSIILFGIAFLYGITGTVNMADLAVKISQSASPLLPLALGFLLTGFGFKAAIFPFHAWKADVITATPAPLGALFAPVSTAVGIYTIFRVLFTVFATSSVFVYYLIVGIGVVTMLLGAILALQQSDLLRLLAYSSISQTGYVLVALGIGVVNSLGYIAGVFHLFNIVAIEALLFFLAGVIIHYKGTGDMAKLGSLSKLNPVITYTFIIGILANVGIPGLNGFSSKWLIYIATLQTAPILTVLAVIVSVLTLAYCLKAYSLIFLGNVEITNRKGGEVIGRVRPPTSMLFPIIILAAFCILFGILPGFGIQISDFIIQSFNNNLYIGAVLG